jgi:PAB1-binding protein PBP1
MTDVATSLLHQFDLAKSGSGAPYNQFKANEERFGKVLTFEEEVYHKPIDYTQVTPELMNKAISKEKVDYSHRPWCNLPFM